MVFEKLSRLISLITKIENPITVKIKLVTFIVVERVRNWERLQILIFRSRKTMNRIFLLVLLLLAIQVSFAQKDLDTESVEVIRSFEATLLDSEKIDVPPTLPDVDTTAKRQTYNVPIKTLSINYPPPRIRPLAFQSDRLPSAYKGYLKAGGGVPNAFLGEGSYHAFVQDQLDVGLNISHYTANNSANLENQRFANTNANAEGTYYADQGFAVKGKLGFTLDNVFYYGYNAERDNLFGGDTLTVPKEEAKQTFTIFDVGVQLFNGVQTAGDLNYSVGFDLYTMGDATPASETGFDLNIAGEKWFGGKHPLRLTLETDFTRYSATSDSIQRLNNFFLQPNFTYRGENFRVKVGANIASSDDVFSLFPDLEVGANVISGILNIFAGANGDLNKNNFRSLAAYNPYIQSSIDIRNTRFFNYYVGAKGNIQGINYRGEVGYKAAEDLALYLDVPNDPDRFRVLYDDVNVTYIKGTVEADIQGFKFTGVLTQNFYDPTEEEKVWHLPALELNIGAQYTTLEDKLQVKGELYIENGVPFVNREGEADNLNGLFDVSVGAEYYFTEKFGGFVNIYNLANNRRERWFRYPTFGLNALAGISVRF